MRTFLALVILVAAGCSGLRMSRPMVSRPDDWSMYGGGPSRANIAHHTLRPPFREAWQYNAQAGVSGTPLVRDSMMIVGTLHGEIQAVNLLNGRRLGYKVLEAPIVGTPVLDGSRVIVSMSGTQETIISMDLSTGSRAWTYSAGPVESSALLYGEFLYVTTLKGSIVCLNKSDGVEQWKWDPESRAAIRSSPASNGSLLCFGSDDGFVYGLDRPSGRLLWKTNTGSSVFASPILSADLVLVGNLKGTLYALEPGTGAVRWKYETGSRIFSAAAGGRQAVYVGSADGILHAVDPSSGTVLWKFAAKSVISSAPLVTGTEVLVGSLDRNLYVIDSVTGKELWKYRADGRIRVSPVLWGEFLLVTSEDKYITALIPEGSL